MMRRQSGFTLIELAIVMLVLTILAAGVLVPLTSSIEMKRYEATQKTMQEAREALIGYAMSHQSSGYGRPYLPCPDIDNNGTEDRLPATGQCVRSEGIFPWATLGIGNSDAWGNRLHYRVATDPTSSASTPDFANWSKGFNSDTKLDGAYQLRVCSPAPSCTATDNAGTPGVPVIAAIILSYGANGWGAVNSNGTTQAPPTSADEIENQNGDTTFLSRSPSAASATTAEFDDLLVALPTALLISRACPSGCP